MEKAAADHRSLIGRSIEPINVEGGKPLGPITVGSGTIFEPTAKGSVHSLGARFFDRTKQLVSCKDSSLGKDMELQHFLSFLDALGENTTQTNPRSRQFELEEKLHTYLHDCLENKLCLEDDRTCMRKDFECIPALFQCSAFGQGLFHGFVGVKNFFQVGNTVPALVFHFRVFILHYSVFILHYSVFILHYSVFISQDKEPSARSELAVIQPLWPSVDLLIYKKLLIRVLESSKILNQYIF